LPWQQGPLSPLFTGKLVAQTVGGLQSMPSMPRIGLQDVSNPAVQVISVRENALSKLAGSHKFAKRRIAASRFYISDDDLRIRALEQYKQLICSDLDGTALTKATGTLLKRASSLKRFFIWMAVERDSSCFRPTEDDL